MIPNYFKTEFDKVVDREYFSNKANPIRKKAFDRFIERGLPNKKWEDWQFTDLSVIKNCEFRISEIDDTPKEKIELSKFGFENLNSIVIYNGHYQKDISSVPEGVRLLSNLEYMEQCDWNIHQPNMSSFDLLNTAFMDSGICLVIEKGIQIDIPLRILFISSGDNQIMVTPRVHIDIEESSSLSLVEQHGGNCNEYLFNESMIINIEDNAKLNHVRIQNNSKNTINIGNLHVKQKNDSSYSFTNFAFGGALARLNLYADLFGKNACNTLNGLSLSDNKQHLDSHIVTNHHASHCISSQNFKSVLKDRSSGVFNGRSIVQHGAEKTDSSQSNKNLLLSSQAIMNSNPQLEIYTDDVKCSHGSTTGELDPDALFYIRSRGVDQQSARALMVGGFASEIIENLNNIEIKNYVRKFFDDWITKNSL